jgi:hypothetical protein
MDNGDDLESVLRQVLREYKSNSLDFVLSVGYTDSDGQRGYVLKHFGDKTACRRLARMVWVALQDEQTKPAATVEEDDDA